MSTRLQRIPASIYKMFMRMLICRSSYPDHEQRQEHGGDDPMEGGAVGGGSGEGDEEEEVEADVLDPANFQLVLPSG